MNSRFDAERILLRDSTPHLSAGLLPIMACVATALYDAARSALRRIALGAMRQAQRRRNVPYL